MEREKDELLKIYYFNGIYPGAFSGSKKLNKVLNKEYHGQYSHHDIWKWLNDRDSYSIQSQVRHKFKTTNVRVSSGQRVQPNAFNDGISYLW